MAQLRAADARRRAGRLPAGFRRGLEPVYHLEKADVIVALDADFLAWGPGRLKDAAAFAARREVGDDRGADAKMNRLYVVERTPTLTGAAADHRLAIAARDVASLRPGHRRRARVGEPSGRDCPATGSPRTPAGSPRWRAT